MRVRPAQVLVRAQRVGVARSGMGVVAECVAVRWSGMRVVGQSVNVGNRVVRMGRHGVHVRVEAVVDWGRVHVVEVMRMGRGSVHVRGHPDPYA